MEVFHNFPANGTAILNGDDDAAGSQRYLSNIYYYGTHDGLDYQAIDRGSMTTDGNLQFRVLCRDGEYPFNCLY